MKEADCWARARLFFKTGNVPDGCPQELTLIVFDLHRGASTDVFWQHLPYKVEEAWCHVACEEFDLSKITRSCRKTKMYFGCVKDDGYIYGSATENDSVRFSPTVFVQKERGREIFLMKMSRVIPAKIVPATEVPAGWSRFVAVAPKEHTEKAAVSP